jgi:hypothetical protein
LNFREKERGRKVFCFKGLHKPLSAQIQGKLKMRGLPSTNILPDNLASVLALNEMFVMFCTRALYSVEHPWCFFVSFVVNFPYCFGEVSAGKSLLLHS